MLDSVYIKHANSSLNRLGTLAYQTMKILRKTGMQAYQRDSLLALIVNHGQLGHVVRQILDLAL